MTIYEIQKAQKTPIWKQRIIECRSSGKSVKEWCKEQGLDFTTYYRWERRILANIIPVEVVFLHLPCGVFPGGQGSAGHNRLFCIIPLQARKCKFISSGGFMITDGGSPGNE